MLLAQQHGLRGYDSVQLAAALELYSMQNSLAMPPITFVCADKQLNQVAQAQGLSVINPEDQIY